MYSLIMNLKIIIISVLLSSNLFAEDISSKLLSSFFKWGNEMCNEFDVGKFFIMDNPLSIIDISNDNMNDYILSEATGRCENSASLFAGGTGGSIYRIYTNPNIQTINFDDYIDLFAREWRLINYNNQKALKIHTHGINCDVSGVQGCYEIISINDELQNYNVLEGPNPNVCVNEEGTLRCYME